MNKIQISFKYSAILLTAAFGRFPVAWLLSKKWGKRLQWKIPTNNCWVNCASGNVFYVEMDGPVSAQPLVLIHGLNANRKQWYYQRKRFGNTYRMVFIDLPGHGNSQVATDLSMQTLATDLKSVLEYLNIKSPVIYGHSWGSALLMQYVLQTGGTNTKAVILHGGHYTNPIKAVQFAPLIKALQKPFIVPLLKVIKMAAPVFDILTWLNFSSGTASLFARFLFFTGNQTAAQLNYTARLAPDGNTKAVTEALLQMIKLDIAPEQLKAIKIPTLVIGDVYDRLHRLKCALFIHKHIPQSQFVVFKAGHQSLVEKHSKLNKAIDGFIKGLE